MNTTEARKVLGFTSIARREPDGAVIVKVPGHNGRFYFVKVTERTITCRFNGKHGPKNCPSVGTGTPCYHSLSAYEKVHGPVLWCETEEDAKKLENLGKHKVEVRSTQDSGAVAWAVLEGKPISQEDRDARILAMCEEYLRLYSKQLRSKTMPPDDYERLVELRRQFGILKMSHSMIVNLVHDAGIKTIKKAQSVLGTATDYAEVI